MLGERVGYWADIQRQGSILAWIVILSVYGADTIAEVKLLISPFLRWSLDFWRLSDELTWWLQWQFPRRDHECRAPGSAWSLEPLPTIIYLSFPTLLSQTIFRYYSVYSKVNNTRKFQKIPSGHIRLVWVCYCDMLFFAGYSSHPVWNNYLKTLTGIWND